MIFHKDNVGNTLRREYYRLLQDIFILMPKVDAQDGVNTAILYSFNPEDKPSVRLNPDDTKTLYTYLQGKARETDGKIQSNALGKIYLKAV
jgi:hypothetical protein